MNTPRKNFDYNSPYAKPVQSYPSQSEDYISLDMGGLTQNNDRTPAGYSGGKFYQQNYRNSHNKANRRNLFNSNYSDSKNNNRQQNYYQKQPRYTPQHNYRKSQDGGFGSQQKQHYHSNRSSSRANNASYVHPSMTEDPWFELMQRMQSLRKSEIDLKTKSPKETVPPLPLHDSSSQTDSDNSNEEDRESVTELNE